MTGLHVGQPVLFWPGEKRGTGQCGRVIAEPAPFGGVPCVRIRKVLGGTDYIALTHIEPIGPMVAGSGRGGPT